MYSVNNKMNLLVFLLPFGVADAWNVKPIRRAAIHGGRAKSSDRCKSIDMQARSHQMIRDMEHYYLSDNQRVCAERVSAVEFAFQTDLRLRYPGRADMH